MEFTGSEIVGETIVLHGTNAGGGPHIEHIPLAAVASWSELLALDDPALALDAIVHVIDNGEPEPDPVTRENVWTDPYRAALGRQQALVREEIRAEGEGTALDPRSPRLRGLLAAYAERPAQVAAAEVAREALGVVAEPPAPVARSARMRTAVVTDPLDGLRNALRNDLAEEIRERRAAFREELAPTPRPE